MHFPAKCPHCGGDGCLECQGTGKIAAELKEDVQYYTQHCLNPLCGFDNGGSTHAGGFGTGEPCIMCDHPETTWIKMEESLADPPWKTHQMHRDLAKYRMARARAAEFEDLED